MSLSRLFYCWSQHRKKKPILMCTDSNVISYDCNIKSTFTMHCPRSAFQSKWKKKRQQVYCTFSVEPFVRVNSVSRDKLRAHFTELVKTFPYKNCLIHLATIFDMRNIPTNCLMRYISINKFHWYYANKITLKTSKFLVWL